MKNNIAFENMKININDKPTDVAENSTLQQVADQLQLPTKGVAMAVNQEMVQREEWAQTPVHADDNILVIKAFCGG